MQTTENMRRKTGLNIKDPDLILTFLYLPDLIFIPLLLFKNDPILHLYSCKEFSIIKFDQLNDNPIVWLDYSRLRKLLLLGFFVCELSGGLEAPLLELFLERSGVDDDLAAVFFPNLEVKLIGVRNSSSD